MSESRHSAPNPSAFGQAVSFVAAIIPQYAGGDGNSHVL
jgi:hypothetical protein